MRCRPLRAKKKSFDLIYLFIYLLWAICSQVCCFAAWFSNDCHRKSTSSTRYKLNNVQFATCVFHSCLVPQTFNFILLIGFNLIFISDGVETMRIMEVNYLLFFQAALYLATAAGAFLTTKQNREDL